MTRSCSPALLESALSGSLPPEEESTLELHLEECDACKAALERLAGGAALCEEASSLLIEDALDEAVPTRDDWSMVDFAVEHLEPADDPNVLGRLGGHNILEIVGRGGMGVVLKAFDRELKRCVAIKVLAPHLAQSSLAKKRFTREAQAAAAVIHPNVLAIYQVQPSGKLPFLVMPLVAGESLAQRLTAQGTLELKEILRIGMQAAAGLAAAHEQGLVHRDVKPSNILLEKGVERAVLTDFGLARAADDVSLTRWGIIAGTPQYMSPEQARGEALDGRSDLFSLGCVLYEMATGVSPFRADSLMATMRRLVDDSPQAMASLNPELPPWFIAIVGRLLEKDPSKRFNSAKEVSELLEGCLAHVQQPTSVPLPAGIPPCAVPQVRRARIRRWAGVLAGLLAIGIGAWAVLLVAGDPPDIAGEWSGEEWGSVVLKATSGGEYTGSYSETVGQPSGEIQLKWSRIERRFNGTWREGENRFGDLSVRLVGNEIRGALTTDAKSKVNPATPRLADLQWVRVTTPDALVRVECFVADVPADFKFSPESMDRAKLAQRNDINIMYAPVVIARSGQKAEIKVEDQGRVFAPGGATKFVLEVTPRIMRDEQIAYQAEIKNVARDMHIGQFLNGSCAFGQRVLFGPIELPARDSKAGSDAASGRKLVGSLVFVHATTDGATDKQDAWQDVATLEAPGFEPKQLRRPLVTSPKVKVKSAILREIAPEVHPTPGQLGTQVEVWLPEECRKDENWRAHWRVRVFDDAGKERIHAQWPPFLVDAEKRLDQSGFAELFNIAKEDVRKIVLQYRAAESNAAEARKPTFGPVLERTINDQYAKEGNNCIDLETGRLLTLPEPKKADFTWVLKNHVDAVCAMDGSPSQGLEAMGGTVVQQVANDQWDTIRAEAVIENTIWQKADFGNPIALVGKVDAAWKSTLPVTYLFRTSRGGMGVLQIVSFTEKPAGVKMRYKLVQEANRAQEAVSIATKTPDFGQVIERELTKPTAAVPADPKKRYLDLDAGDFAADSPPGNVENMKVDSDNVTGLGLVTMPATEAQWAAAPDEVRKALQDKPPQSRTPFRYGPDRTQGRNGLTTNNYFFKTPKGNVGVLQIEANPNKVGTLKVRWKIAAVANEPGSGLGTAVPTVDKVSARPAYRVFPAHRAAALAYSPDGKLLAVGGDESTVTLLDAKTGERLVVFAFFENADQKNLDRVRPNFPHLDVEALAFSPDSKTLAVGNRLGQVKLFDLKGRPLFTLNDPKGRDAESVRDFPRAHFNIWSLAFSPDGKVLATSGLPLYNEVPGVYQPNPTYFSGSLKLWDPQTGVLKKDLEVMPSGVLGIAFSPDGKQLASTGAGTVTLWDANTFLKTAAIKLPDGQPNSLAFSPDGKRLFAGVTTNDFDSAVGNIALLDLAQRKVDMLGRAGSSPANGYVRPVAFFPDGQFMAAFSKEAVLSLWETKPVYQLLAGAKELVERGKSLADEVSKFKHEIKAIGGTPDSAWNYFVFSPNGRQVAIGGKDIKDRPFVEVWDLEGAPAEGKKPEEASKPTGKDESPGSSDGEPAADISPAGAVELVNSAHTFNSSFKLTLWKQSNREIGPFEYFGNTPAAKPIPLPEDNDWGVAPEYSPVDMASLVAEINRQHVPGLAVLKSLTADDRTALQQLQDLRTLRFFSDVDVNEADLAALKNLPGLQTLAFESAQLSDAGFAQLQRFKDLRSLYVRNDTQSREITLTDDALTTLNKLKELRRLDLERVKLSEAGLAQLKDLKSLQILNLTMTRVTDADSVCLKEFPSLQRLSLNFTWVSDAGLANVQDLKNLRWLDLTLTSVTDAGLVHLKNLNALRTLRLPEAITAEALKELQKALPDCHIEQYHRPINNR